MLIRKLDSGWSITVPCKVNLQLKILGRRVDGYHELVTRMLAVSLCDELQVVPTFDGRVDLDVKPCEGASFERLTTDDPAWDIPADESNLVVRALESVKKATGSSTGVHVTLRKGIPAQAGLGGGSADAAAAIVGGLLAYHGAYDSEVARRIAKSLGSDINFFLEGRAKEAGSAWIADCFGRGEIVKPEASTKRSFLVILHPPQGCSTKEVFSLLKCGSVAEHGGDQPIREAIESLAKCQEQLDSELHNDLQVAAAEVNRWILPMLDALSCEPDVEGCCLTGSGSAVFAVVKNEDSATEIANRMRGGLKVRAYAVKSWHAPTIEEQLANLMRR